MAVLSTISGVALACVLLLTPVSCQVNLQQNLVLADCGIGDNPENLTWSTSRQMNWYRGDIWSSSTESNPATPDQVVELPYGDGKYPWNYQGASASMPNGDLWSVWIEDGTPELLRAGRAYSPREGGTDLWCYTYRDRPISTSISNAETICVTAFVCNHRENGPTPWSSTSEPPPAPLPPASELPPAPAPEPTSAPPPAETDPDMRTLRVATQFSPKPAIWLGNTDTLIASISTNDGICDPNPIRNGLNSTVTFTCSITNQTLDVYPLFLSAIRNLGSHRGTGGWFGSSTGLNPNATSDDRLRLPQSGSFVAVDDDTGGLQGTFGCSYFDAEYDTAMSSAFTPMYPTYNRFVLESKCTAPVATMLTSISDLNNEGRATSDP
ncbi:hypothetical protein B0T11DRAFT_350297 [Plectosphaerella cucumerina]|uniref:Ig-like domain-containing protein n=1 Tax=Plectosphaerella cucumerina TaxID=40658 RepID=A0A8K0X6C3_9PEZI|nr:hypothetical protein B0T11DRAFT_350297 [Plectosphaerella cucumerina]